MSEYNIELVNEEVELEDVWDIFDMDEETWECNMGW